MTKTIEEILAPKPETQPRIYAYSIDDEAHKGLLKVGQTTRDVKQRVAEQVKTAAIKNYCIELDESAVRQDGTLFSDHEVRAALVHKGFEKVELEWMRCTVEDVKTVLAELRTGRRFTGTHHASFAMRREQTEAVNKTHAYFHSIWQEDMHAVPRFLWNAKMRFGKTFAAYQLAKRLGAKRVLVVTFKPAVEDAWQTDLESHIDFDGWQYLSRNSNGDPRKVSLRKPVVYFGSFQDLLGRDAAGNIKPKNEWLHTINWDLVVFDEYHFGAWRDTAKELFEGEEDAVALKETRLEYGRDLGDVNEDISELSARRPSSCPSRPRRTSISPARPSGRWPRASSSRSRFLTGRIPTNSAPRRRLRADTRTSRIPTPPCRKCACSPIRCRMSCWPLPAPASSTSLISTPSSRQRARAFGRSSHTRTMCRSGWRLSAAATRPSRLSI